MKKGAATEKKKSVPTAMVGSECKVRMKSDEHSNRGTLKRKKIHADLKAQGKLKEAHVTYNESVAKRHGKNGHKKN